MEETVASTVARGEEYKNELSEVCDRLETSEMLLERERTAVMALEDVRDELLAERDSQAMHLAELTTTQETVEQTLEDAMDRLESTEEELIELRGVSQACDRVNNDARHVLSTVAVKTAVGSAQETAATSKFAAWCCTDTASRQLRLAALPALSAGICMLGESYAFQKTACSNAISEKKVITNTLQDDIHSLRASNNALQNEHDRTAALMIQDRQRFEELADALQENRAELRDTRADLDAATTEAADRLQLLEHLTTVAEEKVQLDQMYQGLVHTHENVSLEFDRLKEHSADLESRSETLGANCDALRGDLEQARNDAVSLQKEHRSDRQVFNEKIHRHQEDASGSKTKADDLERRCSSLENELNMVRTRLDEESNGRERYTGESRELRGQVMRLETELHRVESLKAADKDSDSIAIVNLERKIQDMQEINTNVESNVVSLTTEVESIRRTLVRALDDVCSKYSHQSPSVADFVRSRTSRSARPVTSPSSLHKSRTPFPHSATSASSSTSSQQPQVDGVRGAVREMSTLLHALASTSVAQHEAEQQELKSVQSRTSSVETELRRAQDLLSTARRQHEGTLATTQSDLAAERERTRQLDGLVRQLRENANRTGQSNGTLVQRVEELESYLITSKTEAAKLKTQLVQSQNDGTNARNASEELRDRLREANNTVHRLQKELDHVKSEMLGLEETVASELESLTSLHSTEINRSQNYKDELDQMTAVLRNCKLDLDELKNNNSTLQFEMRSSNEEHTFKRNEQIEKIAASENNVHHLNVRLQTLTR